MVIIRKEKPEDIPAIQNVINDAFSGPAEGNLINKLRNNKALLLSLVAIQDGSVVGQIAFSPVTIESEGQTIEAVGIAPLSVAPEHQRQGIGTKLIEEGFKELEALGHKLIFVLGHPEFFTQLGFVRACRFGIRLDQSVSESAFLVKELTADALDDVSGVVKYRQEFSEI